MLSSSVVCIHVYHDLDEVSAGQHTNDFLFATTTLVNCYTSYNL
jgi:hypothetical protein